MQKFNSLLDEFKAKAKEYGYDTCVAWCLEQADKRKAKEEALLALQ
ncbi:MAG: hypothetical protein K0S01_976 [Herbinix sp.]|jgi:hypothetical protein|nr:hypothetical protein [Herbinix sp.]